MSQVTPGKTISVRTVLTESSPRPHTQNPQHGQNGHFSESIQMYTAQYQFTADKVTHTGSHSLTTSHIFQLSTSLQRNLMSLVPFANTKHGQRMSPANKLVFSMMTRGLEYMSSKFNHFLSEAGIWREHSMHDTPQQLGVAKCMNRSLAKGITTALSQSGLTHNCGGKMPQFTGSMERSDFPHLSQHPYPIQIILWPKTVIVAHLSFLLPCVHPPTERSASPAYTSHGTMYPYWVP